jgi:hypothetical protein
MRNSRPEITSRNNDDDSMICGIKSFSRKINSQVIIWTLSSVPRQKPIGVANKLDKIFGITGRNCWFINSIFRNIFGLAQRRTEIGNGFAPLLESAA